MNVRGREDADETRTTAAPSRALLGRIAQGSLLAALVSVPFTLLLLLVVAKWKPLERLDLGVADRLTGYVGGRPWLERTLEIGSIATDPFVFRLLVVVLAVWCWRQGARRLAVWAVTTAVVGGILGALLKLLVGRARPTFDEPLHQANGYSFPSGHALNSLLGVAILLLVLLPVLSRVGKVLATTAGAGVVLFTGYDRIGLGVHYVSDVLAGWAVALAVLVGTAGAFETWRRDHGLRPSNVAEGVDPEAAPSLRG